MSGLSVLNDVPPNTLQPALANGIHLRWSFERARGFPWFGYYLYRRATSGDVQLQQLNVGGGTAARYVLPDIANDVRLRLGFQADATVTITAFFQRTRVAVARVKGKAGDILPVRLRFDAITSIEVTPVPAPVSIVELVFAAVTDHVLSAWHPVPGFPGGAPGAPYPLALPIAHPDYTCPGAPANHAAAEAIALARVHYAIPGAFHFGELELILGELVDGGPAGPPMASKAKAVAPVPAEPRLLMPRQAPLDVLLLGALHPGIAQMLGLAWVDLDAAATPNQAFDYLIVADHLGVMGGDWQSGLDYLRNNGFGDVDAYLVSERRVSDPAPPLAPPTDVRAYALAPNAAGLRWERGAPAGEPLPPGAAVLYHVWRAALGDGAVPAAPPGPYPHRTKAGPVVVVDTEGGTGTASAPADWPPERMYFVDGGLADGWYGYQLSGVDLFGRHSAASAAAPWHRWEPAPEPRPWYYPAPGTPAGVVHPSAVAVLDKLGPPPPSGVEANVLDPGDPLVVEDARSLAWRAALPPAETGLAGLRVRWTWSQRAMEQAPDTQEFRIYVHRGRRNAVIGATTAVAPAGAGETAVDTDIAVAYAAGALVGARLVIGDAAYRIVANDAGAPVRLRVANRNLEPVRPAAGMPCTIAIPEGHALHADYGAATSWDERYHVVGIDAHLAEELVTIPDGAGKPLQGKGASAAGVKVALGGAPALGGAGIVGSYLWLERDGGRPDKRYRIVAVDAAGSTVHVDAAPKLVPLGTKSEWRIGRLERRYEVLLPEEGAAFRGGSPLTVDADHPIAYGSVGVAAADGRPHTADAARWAAGRWGGRPGNEGRVGAPATIFQVYRGKPAAPELPVYAGDRLIASRADYHDRSYLTFRWLARPGAATHVLRALDETLFATDWQLRSSRTALSPATHASCFPPSWSEDRRAEATAALANLTALAAYAGLSADARAVLARLPGNHGFAWGAGLAERDWDIRRTRTALDPDDPARFPADWLAPGAANAQKRADTAAALNALAAPTGYATLSDPALRILAALPGNEAAFSQVTITPLASSDPRAADVRGPDSPSDYAPLPTLRAFTDTIDGRSTSRYFYRALDVNSVQTRSDASFATPPVYCPDVVPPRVPVLTGVTLGDGAATLRWASNREPDLAAYRVYRATTPEAARDVRLMEHAATVEVAPGAPADRPAAVTWTDATLVARARYYYRVAAVDTADNASPPSDAMTVVAVDARVPEPPVWTDATWVIVRDGTTEEAPWPADGVIPAGWRAATRLAWTSDVAAPRFTVTHRPRGAVGWRPVPLVDRVISTAPSTFTLHHTDAALGVAHAYRVSVTSAAGVRSATAREIAIGGTP